MYLPSPPSQQPFHHHNARPSQQTQQPHQPQQPHQQNYQVWRQQQPMREQQYQGQDKNRQEYQRKVLEPKYVVAGIKNEPHHYQVNQPPYTQYQPYPPANRSERQSRLTFEFPMLIPVIVFFALGLSNLLFFLLNQSSCLDEEVPHMNTPLRFWLLLDAIVKLTLAFLITLSLLLAIFKEGFKDMLTNIWIIITILFIAYQVAWTIIVGNMYLRNFQGTCDYALNAVFSVNLLFYGFISLVIFSACGVSCLSCLH